MSKNISVIKLIVQTWIALHFIACAPNPLTLHGAPIIEPSDPHIVIEVNTDKRIECKADKPVTWISEISRDSDSNVSINDDHEEGDGSEHEYRSYLDFTKINTDHVGRYYCIYKYYVNDQKTNYDDEVKKFKASTIYVFVNDPDKLLVEPGENYFIMAKQFEPFVIPCKPTSPNIQVELVNEHEEVTQLLYDNTIGFTLISNETLHDGFVTCQSRRLNESEENVEQMFFFNVDKRTLESYIPTPELTSDSKFYAIDGNNVTLTCQVTMDSHVMFVLGFVYKDKKIDLDEDHIISDMRHDEHNRMKAHINLTIINALSGRDEGDYKCIVMDHFNNTNSATKTLTFVTEPTVTFDLDNPEIKTTKGKKQSRFLIKYKAYPEATIYIFNPKNEQISADNDVMKREKYNVTVTDEDIKLVLKHPDVHDFGNYTILASSAGKNFTAFVRLIVSEKPTVYIEDTYVQASEAVSMTCRVIAYPEATISWGFIPCMDLSKWPDCGNRRPLNSKIEKYQMEPSSSDSGIYEDVEQNFSIKGSSLSEITQEAPINFTPTQPGHVICRAQNSAGTSMTSGSVQIGDMKEPFMISIIPENDQIANGDYIKLECGATIYNHSDKIEWLKDGINVEEIPGLNVTRIGTTFSHRKIIEWKSISDKDSGTYECEVHRRETNEFAGSKQIAISIHEAQAPVIIPNFNHSPIRQTMGEAFRLDCLVKEGLPIPSLIWYKDGEPFTFHEETEEGSIRKDIVISPNNDSITFNFLKTSDSGIYKCLAENRIGTDEREVDLTVEAISTPLDTGIFIGIIAAFFVFICILALLCLKVRSDKKKIAELKAAGLANFEEGNLESIDPDANLDEQADLLPYNRDVEFPREKLKLGKQLGAGAFGVVVKAIATGIVPYEEETTVAVKMVKKQTDNDVMKALVSELKIMIHLGQHLNVVNLLGAVTKNIAKRELLVIVEYCQFGNLQTFLVKHRPYFIDQIRGDLIDHSVFKNDFRWSDNSAYQISSQGLKYIELVFPEKDNRVKSIKKHHNYINVDDNHYINVISDPNNYPASRPGGQGLVNPASHLNSKGYVRHSGFQPGTGVTQVDSCNTEATVLSTGVEDVQTMSNNSDQPLWRTSYGTDYKGPARTVCTSDLVCWSFQIARGMDYLSSRKVLHGDLAARNVLLCENNVVKICDFGLARNLYKSENYKKKTETPLPFKWLALESISDHSFSVYSDVWAFGIVLWELFTLGKVPYTGMEANEKLFYKIRDGYRMDKPTYSTTDIYYIMLSCWNTKPETRPLFNELEKRLGRFLHESVKDHYVDLNEPYLTSNLDYLKSRPDYLSQFSVPPATEAPKPPLAEEENFYVNEPIRNNDALILANSPSYLAMSPKSGTVRYHTDQLQLPEDVKEGDSPTLARNLDSSPKRKYESKVPIPEEIPMLRKSRDGNDDGVESDDDHQNGYTEMSFSNSQPKPTQRSISNTDYINVLKSNANYVNVPTNNSTITNPSYITINSSPDDEK